MLTLIRPPIIFPKWSRNSAVCPPIGAAYIAASVRNAGHAVKIIDATGEDVFNVYGVEGRENLVAMGLKLDDVVSRADPKTAVFGIACMFSTEWPMAYRLIQKVRKAFPGRVIVVGGEHITSVPEFIIETCPEVDVCVLGEGEETMTELMDKLSKGQPLSSVAGIVYREGGLAKRNAERKRIIDVDKITLPAWDLVPLHNYLDNGLGYGVNRGRSMPLLATRGCPYQCTFCSNPGMWTTRWVARDTHEVLREIQLYLDKYKATNIDFYDLTAVVKKDWIVEFCKLILEKKMDFSWQLPSGTRSEALDSEVTDLMFRSGCRNITYAPESGSERILNKIKKRVNLGRMKDSMRQALKNGMHVKINIIMGLPDETHWDIWQSLLFMAHCAIMGVQDCEAANFSPYPGSELFKRLKTEGKIPAQIDDDYFWNLSTITSVFKTTSFSDHVGAGALRFYLLFGLFMFYGLGFLFHPIRLFRAFVLNPLRSRQETRFEKGYQGVVRRIFLKKGQPKPPQSILTH